MNNFDYTNLSSKQLEYIKFLENQIEMQQAEIIEKDRIILVQQKQIEELKKRYNVSKETIVKNNLERFVTAKDLPIKSPGLKSTVKKTPKKRGRKRGSKNFDEEFLEELSKLNEPIILDAAKGIDNSSLVKINEESTYLVERVKDHIRVHKVITYVYKNDDNQIIRAENNLTPINHSIIAPNLLSDVIAMKYFLGVPEYRYAKWLECEGLPFSQRTMNNWRMQSYKVLYPFYEYLKTLVSSSELNVKDIHVDETYIDVIDNKKDGRNKSYIFCYSSNSNKGKIPLFEYSRDRTTDSVKKILESYRGNITVDGYAGYNSIADGKRTIQRCMVHARREFADIVKTLSEEKMKESKAYQVILKIDAIFHQEALFKDSKYSPEEKCKRRQSQEYMEMVNDLETYIQSIDPEKGTSLYKACQYWKNLAGEQWTYLSNGYVELDNNEAERQAKKFVIDRKNFMFCKSEEGARSGCVLLTLIDLACVNNYDPRDYLEYILSNINKKPYEDLLPWSKSCKEYIKRKGAKLNP